MNWRDRLASVQKRPDGEPTKPTKGLLSVLAVSNPALLQPGTDAQRAHLLILAADAGLPADLVHGLDDADVAACAGLPDDTLRAYLRALEAGQRMDAGQVPPSWGEPVARTCEGCGPVWLWPGAPAYVIACPWCIRRIAGKPVPEAPHG